MSADPPETYKARNLGVNLGDAEEVQERFQRALIESGGGSGALLDRAGFNKLLVALYAPKRGRKSAGGAGSCFHRSTILIQTCTRSWNANFGGTLALVMWPSHPDLRLGRHLASRLD